MRALTYFFLSLAVLIFSGSNAQGAERVEFSQGALTFAEKISTSPGKMTFLVASNSPYKVTSAGTIGNISVKISKYAQTAGLTFGSKSQLPNVLQSCRAVFSPFETPIYMSDRKTARSPGTLTQQSVMVTITHDPEFTPEISISSANMSDNSVSADLCD